MFYSLLIRKILLRGVFVFKRFYEKGSISFNSGGFKVLVSHFKVFELKNTIAMGVS